MLCFQLSRAESANDEEEESVPPSARNKAHSSIELERSKDATSTVSASYASAKIRVTSCSCERLESNTSNSITKQPMLIILKGVSEDTAFEDGYDSDGNVGPFLIMLKVNKIRMKCMMKHR